MKKTRIRFIARSTKIRFSSRVTQSAYGTVKASQTAMWWKCC
ncbi:Uncharacterised protein [Vibrio cholerae]|nr:Uncharacterised protein [Vibrio cholerae]